VFLQRALRTAIAIAAVALAMLWLVIVDTGSHSASDTLRPWLAGVVVIAGAGYGTVLLVERRSRRTRR
jgi:steroid 5-alpha reductase family enzyme